MAMSEIFEAHITYERVHADKVKEASEATGWKFSQIDGDPVLGQQVRCYLTHYDKSSSKLLESMDKVARILTDLGIPNIRRKIECIVYDTATNINRLAAK